MVLGKEVVVPFALGNQVLAYEVGSSFFIDMGTVLWWIKVMFLRTKKFNGQIDFGVRL